MNALNILNPDSSSETVTPANPVRVGDISCTEYESSYNHSQSVTFKLEGIDNDNRYGRPMLFVRWNPAHDEGDRLSFLVKNGPTVKLGEEDMELDPTDEDGVSSIDEMLETSLHDIRGNFLIFKRNIQSVHGFIKDIQAFLEREQAEKLGLPTWKTWIGTEGVFAVHGIDTEDEDDDPINHEWTSPNHEDFVDYFADDSGLPNGQSIIEEATARAARETLKESLKKDIESGLAPMVDQAVRAKAFLLRKLKSSMTIEDEMADCSASELLDRHSGDGIRDTASRLEGVGVAIGSYTKGAGMGTIDWTFDFKYKGDEYEIKSLRSLVMDLRKAEAARERWGNHKSSLASRLASVIRDRVEEEVIANNDAYATLRKTEDND